MEMAMSIQSRFACRHGWILLGAACIILGLVGAGEVLGNDATNVKLFVGKDQAEAESSSNKKSVSVVQNTSYWVRVEWSKPGQSNDYFNVKVFDVVDGVEHLIKSENNVADGPTSPQTWVKQITTSTAFRK